MAHCRKRGGPSVARRPRVVTTGPRDPWFTVALQHNPLIGVRPTKARRLASRASSPAARAPSRESHLIATHEEGAPAQPDPQGITAPLPYTPERAALELAVRRLDEAEHDRQPAAMCDALAGIARCYGSLSAYPNAMDFMRQALRWSYALGGVDQRVELLCELAELSCSAAEAADDAEDDERQARAARDLARDMAFEAARVATHAADPHWEIKVLLRASDALDRCGDHDDAITLQTRAMTLMVRHPDVSEATIDGNDALGGRVM
jgi:tetratricopeptide (TPR) repeat protein